MSRKSTVCYEHALKYIHDNIIDLTCSSFTTDYEKSMRNSLKKLYPESQFVTCYFHYCQAVKRKAYSTDSLHNLLQRNEDALFVYHRIQCLPLLPAEDIAACFDDLEKEAFSINKKVFKPFLDYFKKQWIIKVIFKRSPLFVRDECYLKYFHMNP